MSRIWQVQTLSRKTDVDLGPCTRWPAHSQQGSLAAAFNRHLGPSMYNPPSENTSLGLDTCLGLAWCCGQG